MQLLTNIRQAAQDFRQLLTRLAAAIEVNTKATAALHITALENLAASRATQTAVTFLERAERHRREQAGIRSDF